MLDPDDPWPEGYCLDTWGIPSEDGQPRRSLVKRILACCRIILYNML